MPGWWAGLGVGKYNAESSKQGSKRFNFITKTIHFAHLCILFIYAWPSSPEITAAMLPLGKFEERTVLLLTVHLIS